MFDFVLSIVWMTLFALGWLVQLSLHGKPRTGKYNIFIVTAFWAIPVYLVVKAYFINYGV